MNKHDKDNLNFLLTISQEAFDQWLSQASQEDIDYALEIIRMSKIEKIMDLIDINDKIVEETGDMSDALELINKIKGK